LQYCVLLLVGMHFGRESVLPYPRAMCIALLQWTSWYTELPGVVFCEETCEAMLSKLAKRSRRCTNMSSLDQVDMLFATLPDSSEGLKDKTQTRCGQSLVSRLNLALQVRLQRMNIDRCAFYKWSAGVKGKIKGKWIWDENHVWPLDPCSTTVSNVMRDLCIKSLHTLQSKTARSGEVEIEQTRVFGLLSDSGWTAVKTDRSNFLRDYPVPDRYNGREDEDEPDADVPDAIVIDSDTDTDADSD
jgi:hypothetical protein